MAMGTGLRVTIETSGSMPADVAALLYGLAVEERPVVGGTIADLYGAEQVEAFSLYGVDPHCDCDPTTFCRNPLHPGPCKGWKRTLGAVAPGALRALETERIRKAEERRKAAVKRYTDAGKKVPARLKKPITSAHMQPQAGAGGLVITGKPTAPTSKEIEAKLAARRAAKAAQAPATPSGKPRDGDGDGKLNEGKNKPAPGTTAKSATAPAGPSAPLGPNATASQKIAHAMANRTAPGARVAKKQVEAYDRLDKAEFDALPQETKDRIKADLDNASAKFLDPKKQQQVADLKTKLGLSSGGPAHVPTPKPGRDARLDEVAAAGDGSGMSIEDRWNVLKTLDKKTFDQLDATEKASVAAALDEVVKATHDPNGHNLGSARSDATRILNEIGEKRHGFEGLMDRVRTAPDQDFISGLGALLTSIDNSSLPQSEQEKIKSEFLDEIINDASRPDWARQVAYTSKPGWLNGMSWELSSVMKSTSSMPDYQLTGVTANLLFKVSDKDLKGLPDFVQRNLLDRRSIVVGQHLDLYPKGSNGRTRLMENVLGGNPQFDPTNISAWKSLPDKERGRLREALDDHVANSLAANDPRTASSWQSVGDRLDGKRWPDGVMRAIDAAQTSTLGSTKMSAFQDLTPKQFKNLPDAHAVLIEGDLLDLQHSVDRDIRRRAALKLAELHGNMPNHRPGPTLDAALAAGVLNQALEPDERAKAYNKLAPADYDKLTNGGRLAVAQDMRKIADDPHAANMTLQDRFNLMIQHDYLTNAVRTKEQDDALAFVLPSYVSPDPNVIAVFDALPKADYDAMPKPYREAIDLRLELLKSGDPHAYDRIKSKFDPSYVPPAPVTPKSGNPQVDAALDVVYGVDPKARTAARQLTVYGQLRTADFNTLSVQERNTILADLSYIETTSKSADAKARARKYIDKFAPPGTPAGSPATGVPVPPANAVANQTRYPDPDGVAGMLKQSKNPGQRGDEWVTAANGKRVWGKYGAAGLMLRHVDQNGTERFLIAQRGPAISNPGYWQLPGGAIESNETFAEGATRETLEELGFKEADFSAARVHGYHEAVVGNVPGAPTGDWRYTSFAATVPTQLVPDLSKPGARAETSDARWMTLQEIEDLDRQGKLLGPLAGGQLQRNIMSLYPSPTLAHVTAPGPQTTRPTRLAPGLRGANPANAPGSPATPHKQSTATNLVQDQAAAKALLDRIKGPVRASYRGKSADERLAAINAIQGHDRTPTVMSKAEMDRLLATGDYIEIWRGVTDGGGKTAKQIAEEFRSGPDWGGLGIFGNGYYFAEDKALAEYYSGGGWRSSSGGKDGLIRALIPKSATMINLNQAQREAATMPSSAPSSYQPRRSGMGGATLRDPGRYAAAKGADGIKMSASDYRSGGGGGSYLVNKPIHIVVNRSILIVQEA